MTAMQNDRVGGKLVAHEHIVGLPGEDVPDCIAGNGRPGHHGTYVYNVGTEVVRCSFCNRLAYVTVPDMGLVKKGYESYQHMDGITRSVFVALTPKQQQYFEIGYMLATLEKLISNA